MFPARLMFAVSLAIAGCAQAIAGPKGSESTYFEPLPVVLTASRLPQPLQETPGSVSVIDEDLIRATGYRDLARLLRLVPGMQVGQERGHNHWVTYHGLGIDYPNQIQVLLDGRSVLSAGGFGGANWSALPIAIEDIDRIEVVRGPNSAAYGSNAFLGVVNIRTRHPRAEAGSSVALNGGDGLFDATARVARTSGPLALRLTAQHGEDKGMPSISDDFVVDRGNVAGNLRLGREDEINLRAGLSTGQRGLGNPDTPFKTDDVRDGRHRSQFMEVEWRRTSGADEEMSLSLSRSDEHSRDAWFGEGMLPLIPGGLFVRVPVNNNVDSLTDELRFEHSFAAGERVRMLWGAEWRRGRMYAPFLFHVERSHREDARQAYGSLEWRVAPEWVLNGGGTVERAGDGPVRFIPRLAMNWLVSPAHTLRTSVSRAYRHPSFFERHADVQIRVGNVLLARRHQPNPGLDPQRVDAVELGYLGQLPGQRGVLDVRVFQERITDLIRRDEIESATPAPGDPLAAVRAALGSSRWTNQDAPITLTGLEYQLQWHPAENSELILNHTLVDADSRDARAVRTIAPYVASLTWLQRAGAWEGSLTVLRMAAVDFGTGFVRGFDHKVDAYTALDASVAWQSRIGVQPVTLRLTGINLLGDHQEVANRPLQQRAGDRIVNQVGPQVHFTVSMPM